MKVKLDENMPESLAPLLKQFGHDAHTVPEEKLSGQNDPTVLDAARSEGRILMTFDLDFADIRRYPPGQHGGIIVFRLEDQRWDSLRRPATRLVQTGVLERLAGGLAIVDEQRIRIRSAG